MTGQRRDCTCPRAQHQHGTRGAYVKDGCRCFACRIAHSRILASAKAGHGWRDDGVMVPRIGTVRRLQALHALGWSEREIGDLLGVSKQAVRDLRTHDSNVMLAITAARVGALYDVLWDVPPRSPYRRRTANWARAQDWALPMEWDDDEIDDPDAQPHRPTGSSWDRRPCGTPAAYTRHLRRGEKPCTACTEANRVRTAGSRAGEAMSA